MKIAFIDFETTGLDPLFHEIIEIGVVVFDDKTFKISQKFGFKIRPMYPQRIDEKARAINGYSEREWYEALGAHDAWTLFAKVTMGCILAAHNMTFDWSFLEQVMKQQPRITFDFHYHKLDTLSMAYARIKGAKSLSLKSICEMLNITPEPPIHRALNGALKGYEVFKKLMQ